MDVNEFHSQLSQLLDHQPVTIMFHEGGLLAFYRLVNLCRDYSTIEVSDTERERMNAVLRAKRLGPQREDRSFTFVNLQSASWWNFGGIVRDVETMMAGGHNVLGLSGGTLLSRRIAADTFIAEILVPQFRAEMRTLGIVVVPSFMPAYSMYLLFRLLRNEDEVSVIRINTWSGQIHDGDKPTGKLYTSPVQIQNFLREAAEMACEELAA